MHYRCLGGLGVCILLCGCFLVNAPSPPPPPVTEVSVTPDHLAFPPTRVGDRSAAQQLIVVTPARAVSLASSSGPKVQAICMPNFISPTAPPSGPSSEIDIIGSGIPATP